MALEIEPMRSVGRSMPNGMDGLFTVHRRYPPVVGGVQFVGAGRNHRQVSE